MAMTCITIRILFNFPFKKGIRKMTVGSELMVMDYFLIWVNKTTST